MKKENIEKWWWSNLLSPTDKDLPWLKFKYLFEFLKDKNWRLLEVGCWWGKNLISIYNYFKNFKLYWVDIDAEAIRVSKDKFNFIDFYCSSWDNLPFENNYLDIIVISDYLEHVLDFDKAVNELNRVLKTWWYIHAFIPCEWEVSHIYWLFKKIFWFNVKETWWHVQFFRKKELEKNFINNWFEIVDKNYSYHLLWSILDFSFYSLLLNKKIAKIWWENNKYYNDENKSKATIISKMFNFVLSIANLLAYYESTLLKNISFWSTGLHIILKKH